MIQVSNLRRKLSLLIILKFCRLLVKELTTSPSSYIKYGGGNHQSEKGMVHFRRKKKEILDQILGKHRYDRQIRPAGHVNDTSGFLLISISALCKLSCYSLQH